MHLIRACRRPQFRYRIHTECFWPVLSEWAENPANDSRRRLSHTATEPWGRLSHTATELWGRLLHTASGLRKAVITGAFCALLVLAAASLSFGLPAPYSLESDDSFGYWLGLGPMGVAADQALSSTTAPISGISLGSPLDQSQIIWDEGRPYRWVEALADKEGRIDLAQIFGAPAGRSCVYLYRQISSNQVRQVALSIGSNGPVRVWLNGSPLPGIGAGVWSPPGDDRWIEVVSLVKGTNELLVQSMTPEVRLPWSLRVRVLYPESFSRGEAIYPNWVFSSPPPWTTQDPPRWVRWGDPAIQDFVGVPATSGSLEVARLAEVTSSTVYRMAVGQDVGIRPFLRGSATLLSLRASMDPDVQKSLEDRVSFAASRYSDFMLLGPAKALPPEVSSTGHGQMGHIPALSKSLAAAFEDPALALDDPDGTRVRILRRTQSFPAEEASHARNSPWLGGWLYFSAAAGEREVAYTLQLPGALKTGASAPLLMVIPPRDADPFYVAVRQPALAAEASRMGWLVAVPNIRDGLDGVRANARALEAVRADIAKRFQFRYTEVCLLGVERSASAALLQGLSRPTSYAGVATLDGSWDTNGSWAMLFSKYTPRPALYVAGQTNAAFSLFSGVDKDLNPDDGPWILRRMTPNNQRDIAHDLLLFLQQNAMHPQPQTQARGPVSKNQPSWLVLRQAANPAQPATLTGDVDSTNSVVVQPRNVSLFDVMLKGMTNMIASAPIVIEIDQQTLRVIGQSVPEALRLRYVVETDRPSHWEASQISASAVEQAANEEKTLGELESDMPARPDEKNGGIGRLMARAARLATGAQIALIPARSINAGQAKGPVVFTDLEGWSRDSSLATATLPVVLLTKLLERDFAGRRLLVTDGVDALATDPSVSTEEGDEPTTGLLETTTSTLPAVLPSERGKIFESTSLTTMGPDVVVVGWSKMLQNPAEWFDAGDGEKVPTDTVVHECGISQHEAIIRMLQAEPKVPALAPDIRVLPHKRAEVMKEKP